MVVMGLSGIMLPLLMNTAQLIFYLGLAFMFGGIIMWAYKGHISGLMKFAGRLVFGFLAVLTGMGISWVIPYFSNISIYVIIQNFLNVIPGGLIATIVLYATLKMVSYNIFNVPGIEKNIRHLEEMKKKAKGVESEEKARNRHGIRHPVRLAGLVGFAAFLAIGLAGFQGFPNVMEDIFEEFGIGQLSGECAGALSLYENRGSIAPQPYTNPNVEAMVEDYTGEDVTQTYSIETEDGFYISTFTQNKACLSTTNTVCMCYDIDDI